MFAAEIFYVQRKYISDKSEILYICAVQILSQGYKNDTDNYFSYTENIFCYFFSEKLKKYSDF